MALVLWLAVAVPAVAAVAARAAGRRSALVSALGALAAALPAWILLLAAASGERERSTFVWLPGGDGLEVGLRLDALSAVMAALVATVGLVVLVYSVGYFASDPRAASARAGLLAFLAVMQGLVLADGFLPLLVFWELVGALSARLIAYRRDDVAAPAGAVRAFVTTRAADLGLYLALMALYAAGSDLAFASTRPDGALGAVVGIGLVVAAMGKSAQAPLQTWLAGAMVGPTPVSALLHSATMVAAGVYLLVRSGELLAGWPLEVAGWVGAVTAVAGACIALGQSDLKRVLAGSTTSQLGLMFVGAAAGGPAVAIFHLVAHAAGKAGLFLTAGIFQHRRGTTDLVGLRGVAAEERAGFALFTLSALSIAGAPPLAAFWSKESIVVVAEEHPAWLALVLVAAGGSAAYLLRPALVLRGPGETGVAAPAGRAWMLGAAAALAAGTLGLGLIGPPLAELLGASLPTASASGIALSLAATAAGAIAVFAGVRAPRRLAVAARRQLYTDEALGRLVQRPVLAAAHVAARFDNRVVDAAVDGTGRGVVAIANALRRVVDDRVVDAAVDGTGRLVVASARSLRWVEERGVDAAVDGLAARTGRLGRSLTRLQTGRLFEYLRDTVVGIAAIALVVTLTALI